MRTTVTQNQLRSIANARGCFVERTETDWTQARFVGSGCGYWNVVVNGLYLGRLHRRGLQFLLMIEDKRAGMFSTQAAALAFLHNDYKR